MFKRRNSVVKIWQLIRGGLTAGAPSHGTTATMVNPALAVTKRSIISHSESRHCLNSECNIYKWNRTEGAATADNYSQYFWPGRSPVTVTRWMYIVRLSLPLSMNTSSSPFAVLFKFFTPYSTMEVLVDCNVTHVTTISVGLSTDTTMIHVNATARITTGRWHYRHLWTFAQLTYEYNNIVVYKCQK